MLRSAYGVTFDLCRVGFAIGGRAPGVGLAPGYPGPFLFNDYERKCLNRFSSRYHLLSSQQSRKNNPGENQQRLPARVHVARGPTAGGSTAGGLSTWVPWLDTRASYYMGFELE
jgi:hypothetical protein